MNPCATVYGLMAEFATADALLEATRQARRQGYEAMDAYSPYPVEGLAEELGLKKSCIPFVVLVSALVGTFAAFFMQYYSMAVDYPINVGGRPHNSWPAFIPVTFEVMILVAAFAALFGMFFINGLPRPNHPVFNAPRFAYATQDRFFLCIEAKDAKFLPDETAEFLRGLNPHEIVELRHSGPARVLTDGDKEASTNKEES